jgi:hypothetical protein
MAMRILAGAGGLAVVLVGAWYNISMSDAPSFLAPAAVIYLICALVSGIGGPIVGSAFHRGHPIMGCAILIFILAGEGYGIISTMDRTVRAEDAAQKPLIDAAERHTEALRKVAAAEDAIKALAIAEPRAARLTVAMAALDAANKAITDQAALRTCLKNCVASLQAAATAARHEVELAQQAADDDLRAARVGAQQEKTKAQALLAANPLPASASALADRIGVEPWKIDIAKAILLSLTINGTAMGFLAFAFHARSHRPAPATRQSTADAISIIDITPVKATRAEKSNQKQLPSPSDLQVARFGRDCLIIDDHAEVPLRDIYSVFTRWAADNNQPALAAKDVAAGFRTAFERLGVSVENGRAIGLTFKERHEDAA